MNNKNIKNILQYIKDYSSTTYRISKFAEKATPIMSDINNKIQKTVGNRPAYALKDGYGNVLITDDQGRRLTNATGTFATESDLADPADKGSEPFGGQGTPGSPDIKDMQTEIMNLAKTVITYENKNPIYKKDNRGNVIKDRRGKPTQETDKFNRPQYEPDPKKHFNDFLIEQYAAKSMYQGEEFSPESTSATEGGSELIEMKNIINQFQKIGGANEFRTEDGKWGERTQNAVKNIWAFAQALVKVIEDFGIKVGERYFNRNTLQQFGRALGPIRAIANNRITRVGKRTLINVAKAATPFIQKLNVLYRTYVVEITKSPAFRPFIEGTYSFFTLEPGGDDPGEIPDDLVEEDRIVTDPSKSQAFLFNVKLPTPSGMTTIQNFPLSYLKDLENFKKLATALKYPPQFVNNYSSLLGLLNYVKDHVQYGIVFLQQGFTNTSSASAPAQPAPAQPAPAQPPPPPAIIAPFSGRTPAPSP